MALLLVHLVPDAARSVNFKLRWPASPQQWLSSLAIFGQLGSSQALVPPAWSLNVELVYYAAMALVLSRHRWIIVVWFAASVAYTIWTLQDPLDFNARYRDIPGASLPFALGALIYSFRERLSWLAPRTAAISAGLFLGNVALAAWAPVFSPLVLHFYLSLLFGGCLLAALARVRPGDLPGWVVRIDRIGGNLSYPIFLCHFHVAVVVVWLGFAGVRPREGPAL